MSKLFVLKGRNRGVTEEFKFRVDDEDAYLLRAHAWRLRKNASGGFHVCRKVNKVYVSLAHVITGVDGSTPVRHANNDTSDFRRKNLAVGGRRVGDGVSHCYHGHELNEENRIPNNSLVGYYCRACNQKAVTKYRITKAVKEHFAA